MVKFSVRNASVNLWFFYCANLSSNQEKNILMSVNSLYEVDKCKDIYERSPYNLN